MKKKRKRAPVATTTVNLRKLQLEISGLPPDKQWEMLCVAYPRDTMVSWKFSAEEIEAWEAAAARDGKVPPQWIADVLNRAAGIS